MNEFIVFPNAPIIEAILDIRVILAPGVSIEVFDGFYETIKPKYPLRKNKMHFEASFNLGPKGALVEKKIDTLEGYLFDSKEGRIVQARLNGFTLNKLRPYQNWASMKQEAKELWNLYWSITKPLKISRIGLRFINRIEIPLPIDNFQEYFVTFPNLSSEIPQGIASFFMRLVIPKPEIEATSIIIETMEDEQGGKLPIIFDIDVFIEKDYIGNEERMWSDFDNLRFFKNEIFFRSLTEKTKEIFK